MHRRNETVMKNSKKNITLGECLVELTKLDLEACRKELRQEHTDRRREIYSALSKHLSKMKGFKVGL